MAMFKIFMYLIEQLGLLSIFGNYILDSIGNIWHFPISLDQKMDNLKRKRDELNARKVDTTARIKTKLRPGKKVKKEVSQWIERVEKINPEIDLLVVPSSVLQVGVRGFLSRGFLQKNVCKKTDEVEALLQNDRFSDDLFMDDPSRLGQLLSTPRLVGGTMNAKRDEVLGYLTNGDIHKIGIYGMPGMGKTTLSKFINNELLKKPDRFDIVIWLSVSKNWSIFELQNKIARAMKITIDEDEGETRAGKLSETLSQKGRFVLILDDVWEDFSLEEVGIPEPSRSNGSKLVLTARSLDVCQKMGCEEVKMEPLSQADAWTLFVDKVGQKLTTFANVERVARYVAAHCAGLPLAINIVAGSMRGEYSYALWKNALNELDKNVKSLSGLEFKDRVIQQLRFSYERLNDLEVKKCFLISETYGGESGILKKQLIDKWISDRLIKEMGNMQANRYRGEAIVKKLVDNCLLEYVGNERVKMHDLVRDMAKIITLEFNAS